MEEQSKGKRLKAKLAYMVGAMFALAGLLLTVLGSIVHFGTAGMLLSVATLWISLGSRYKNQAAAIERVGQPKGGLFQRWQT